jgi:predicted Rossmann fold nucleotide-binding protein DprA/Smf involved in DNA uptake
MELDASLSWLAMTMTPGVAARLSARLLRQFGSPEGVFRASLPALESSFAPNQLIKQGAKLVTSAEDVIEELPTPVRAVLVQAEAVGGRAAEPAGRKRANPLPANHLRVVEHRPTPSH